MINRETKTKVGSKAIDFAFDRLSDLSSNLFVGAFIAIIPDLLNLIATKEQVLELAKLRKESLSDPFRVANQEQITNLIKPIEQLIQENQFNHFGGLGYIGGNFIFVQSSSRNHQLFQNEHIRLSGKLKTKEQTSSIYIYSRGDVQEVDERGNINSWSINPEPGSQITRITVHSSTTLNHTTGFATISSFEYQSGNHVFEQMDKNTRSISDWQELEATLSAYIPKSV